MKPRALAERARRIVDRLSERIEDQAMRKGADAPNLVSIVGVFHRAAGDLERFIEERPYTHATILAHNVRILRRIVRSHVVMVDLRAIFIRERRA